MKTMIKPDHCLIKTYEYDTPILKHDGQDAAYIAFPYDVALEFGVKGQVKVRAMLDGYEYRGSLAKMGLPFHCLGVNKKVRQAIGKQPGDVIHVILIQDLEERTVEVPEDFQNILNRYPKALEFFKQLSFTHQKDYVAWINSAKKEDTRKQRLEKAVQLLGKQIRQP